MSKKEETLNKQCKCVHFSEVIKPTRMFSTKWHDDLGGGGNDLNIELQDAANISAVNPQRRAGVYSRKTFRDNS